MDEGFASLQPSNAAAKRAFSNVVKESISGHPPPPWMKFMVCRSATQARENALEIEWEGCYSFNIANEPHDPRAGWALGSQDGAQVVDCRLTNDARGDKIRGCYINFKFDPISGYVVATSRAAPRNCMKINGKRLNKGGSELLPRYCNTVKIGLLEYDFKYTEFARSEAYKEARAQFMGQYSTLPLDGDFGMTPTPAVDNDDTPIKDWVLTSRLGDAGEYSGDDREIWLAIDSASRMVMIKKLNKSPDCRFRIAKWRRLNRLALATEERQRLLSLLDVIDCDDGEKVALVFEPVMRNTLDHMLNEELYTASDPWVYGRLTNQLFKIMRDILKSVAFLHENSLVHGDLRLDNIAYNGDRGFLVDLDDCFVLRLGMPLDPNYGNFGDWHTVAPERTQLASDHTIDVFAAGMLIAQLLFGTEKVIDLEEYGNPWSLNGDSETLNRQYLESYETLMVNLDAQQEAGSSVCRVVKRMIRYPFAERVEQRAPRESMRQILSDPYWQREV